MLFKDINKRFTELTMEYVNKGYYINCATMAGHQGEVSKIDLTDGKEIVRIVIDNFIDFDGYYQTEGVEIIIGRAKDEIKPNERVSWGTIWNNNLDVISDEKFYRVGGRRHGECYGTREDAIKAQNLSSRRRANRDCNSEYVFPEATHKLVLAFVKRQPRCKSVRLADIEKVYSVNYGDHKRYFVTARGLTFTLR